MKKTNQGKASFLTSREAKLKLIEDCFNQSVYQLSMKGNQPRTECVPQQPREWLKLSLLQSIKQPLTQDQMRHACETIQNDTVSDLNAVPKHKYTVIDFANGSQNWDEQVFTLNSMVLNIEVLGSGVAEGFDFAKGDRLDASVYIRFEDRTAQAFLRAKGIDGKEHYFELEEFSMLYHLCDNNDISEKNDNANDIQKSDELPIEDKKATGEIGMFTLFNRTNNLLFITTY